MYVYLIFLIGFFISSFISSASLSEAKDKVPSRPLKPLTIITHDIEPYMSKDMPGHGAVISAMRSFLKKEGYELKIVMAPTWTRAKIDALNQNSIDCLIPVRARENDDVFNYSEFSIHSPWVLIERKDKPIHWNKTEELKGLVAGNIQGVELRPGVQELIDKNVIRLENAPNTLSSLLQLANKRVDFVFADPFIFTYAIETESELEPFKKVLQINPKPWYVEKYGMACKKNVDSNLLRAFPQSTDKFKKDIEDYLKNVIVEAKIKKQKKQ